VFFFIIGLWVGGVFIFNFYIFNVASVLRQFCAGRVVKKCLFFWFCACFFSVFVCASFARVFFFYLL
jgi:hypothetical protein